MSSNNSVAAGHRLTQRAAIPLAFAAAIGTSAIYLLQPAVAGVAAGLHTSLSAVGVALGFGPLGYLCGLALVVPLVDHLNARLLLATMFAGLGAALAVAAATRAVWQLAVVMVLIGAASAVGAALSSLVGRLADPSRRATVLGIVTAGISAGILAGRIAGGWLTGLLGWRRMLLTIAAAAVVVAIVLVVRFPAVRGTATDGYLSTLRSIPVRLRDPTLRWAAIRGACWFVAFSGLWAGIAVALSRPPFTYSAERIGAYAAAGLIGILATQIAGRLTDAYGARAVLIGGLGLALLAAVALSTVLSSTPLTLICLALFDAGTFAAQVANQSTVLAIDPAAPARNNSTYMVVFFVGGSLGSAVAAPAVITLGWPLTVCLLAVAVALSLLTAVVRGPRRPDVSPDVSPAASR